ncbi:MAG: alcohol dehydrogenase catalytic domain-containing protein, partial [Rickettsiales bacterium]
MARAITFEQTGGPSVLKMVEIQVAKPQKTEVQLRQLAIEVNYVDVYHRTGLYPMSGAIKIPGVSAVGIIEAVGDEVTRFHVGDK